MRVSVERCNLIMAVGRVHRVAERRSTVPILTNVLLRAENDQLLLKATDLGIGIAESIPAIVEIPGGSAVPAYTFYDIVKKLPDGATITLSLQSEKEALDIRSCRSQFSLQALREENFAGIDAGVFANEFSLPANRLKYLLDCTQFAISNDETRFHLNGMYLHVIQSGKESRLCAVATDGHRLAKADIPSLSGMHGMPAIIIPKKTITELHRLTDNVEGSVQIGLSDTKICVQIGPTTLTSKLIDSSFPKYTDAIPKNNDKQLIVDKVKFANALGRVSVVSSDRCRTVKLKLRTGTLAMEMVNSGYGFATEDLEAEYSGDNLDIGFNARYLSELTHHIRGDRIVFSFLGPTSATLIQGNEDKTALYILMPMQI